MKKLLSPFLPPRPNKPRRLKEILEAELGLKINGEKSKVVDVEKEAVRFFGFEIKRMRSRRSGKKFAIIY